jgi:hypothetical protein
MLVRLKAVGFSGNLLAFFFNVVYFRKLAAYYRWIDLKDWTYKGLPQVIVLSPTLYSLYGRTKIQNQPEPDVEVYSVNRQQNWRIENGKKHKNYSSLFKEKCIGSSTK